MAEKLYENFGFEVTKAATAKFIQAILGFVGIIVFARVLGPTDFGGVYLLISVVGVLKQITGYEGAAKRRFAEADIDNREIVGAVGLFNIAVIATTAIAALAVERHLVTYTGLENAAWLLIGLMSALVLFSPYQTLLAARGLLSRQIWIDTVRSVLTLGLQLSLILLGFGASGVIYGTVGATLLCLPLTQHALRVKPSIPSRETIQSLWEYTKYMVPTSFIGKVYSEYDMILIGFLVTQNAVGYYQAALKLTVPAIFLSQVASSGLMSEISNLHSRSESFSRELTNTLSFGSLLSLPIFFGALAIPEWLIITVYEPAFRSAATLLVGLALYQVVRSQSSIYRQTLFGMDRPDKVFRIDAVTLSLNLLLGFLLVVEIGTLGAVIATIAAESLRFAMSASVVRDSTQGVELYPRPLLHQVIAALTMFAVVTGAEHVVASRSVVALLVVVSLGVVTYFISLTAISSQFRHTVRSILQPIVESANN
ncbi:probable RfbX family transport protein [Halobacterium hubeiense]|uniref:Probable RfbX family transport protein n=1 Tax=Halobacterium hubeiense TaxID=1407499 RepID=A0A0U5H2V2_9EURY|nr:oligosaccharide flippase family protein [Halobacterium hubeiense]CQH55642.1 probable RfbX family transport protein [Halobacterium hubeiense]